MDGGRAHPVEDTVGTSLAAVVVFVSIVVHALAVVVVVIVTGMVTVEVRRVGVDDPRQCFAYSPWMYSQTHQSAIVIRYCWSRI